MDDLGYDENEMLYRLKEPVDMYNEIMNSIDGDHIEGQYDDESETKDETSNSNEIFESFWYEKESKKLIAKK